MFTCPRCNEDTVSIKDKYRAGLWLPIHCPKCGAKLTAYPWVLMIVHMLYVWNVVWFFGMYWFTGNAFHFVYMAVVWLVLDIVNVNLVPLAVMRGNST
jgi:hypothetical protein